MASGPTPTPNHARYLVVLALAAFALPLVARTAEAAGAPRTPTGVTSLLLAAVLMVAVLVDRPGAADPSPDPASGGARGRGASEREEPHARL